MKKNVRGTSVAIVNRFVSVVSSTRFIIGFALLIAAATFGAWQYHNTTNVNRVFWGMVDNSLSASAYTRQTERKQGSQGVTQIFQTALSPQNRLFSDTIYTQTGVDAARAVTENIGTPERDYVRYTDIKTADNLNFASVLGTWGVTEPEVAGETSGQLYNQAVLGLIPVGNLSLADRRELVKIMKDTNAYSYKLIETKRSLPFGRPSYVIELTISPVGYITALQRYADMVGLNHLKQVEPKSYSEAQKIVSLITVDGWSHNMTATDQMGGTKTEQISGWNLKKSIPSEPTKAIPVDELQSMLQSIQ